MYSIFSDIMSDGKTAIRTILRYLWKKGLSSKAAAEEICSVEGKKVIDRRTASNWFKRFNGGDMSILDRPRSGRQTMVNDKGLKAMVVNDPHKSTRSLSAALGHSKDTINRHLHNLGFSRKTPIEDPHELTILQADQRISICKQLLQNPRNDRFWKQIITGDEKWIFFNNYDRRSQWVSCGEKPMRVPKTDRFGKKILLCVWWNFEGIVHFELVPRGASVNAELYTEQLDRVYDILKTRYPNLINRKRALLQHDNAPAHRARLTTDKIQKMDGVQLLPHPPYSPDIAPSDYGLFRSMVAFFQDRRFETVQEVEQGCREFFSSKTKDWYFHQIRQLAERWLKVIENKGLYFEE